MRNDLAAGIGGVGAPFRIPNFEFRILPKKLPRILDCGVLRI